MKQEFLKTCKELEDKIRESYESSVTLDQAEKLAAEFLYAQMKVAEILQEVDLDSRMRKSGNKAIRAAVYLAEAGKGDKKPSDVMLNAMVDTSPEVSQSQDAFDHAEADKNFWENYYQIFREAHIFYRGLAKQSAGF